MDASSHVVGHGRRHTRGDRVLVEARGNLATDHRSWSVYTRTDQSSVQNLRVGQVLDVAVLPSIVGLDLPLKLPGIGEAAEEDVGHARLKEKESTIGFSHNRRCVAYPVDFRTPENVVNGVILDQATQVLESLLVGNVSDQDQARDARFDLVLERSRQSVTTAGLLDGNDMITLETDALRIGFVVLLAGSFIAELDHDLILCLVPDTVDSSTVHKAQDVGYGRPGREVPEEDTTVRSGGTNGVLRLHGMNLGHEFLRAANASENSLAAGDKRSSLGVGARARAAASGRDLGALLGLAESLLRF